jgi:hypothetical protein
MHFVGILAEEFEKIQSFFKVWVQRVNGKVWIVLDCAGLVKRFEMKAADIGCDTTEKEPSVWPIFLHEIFQGLWSFLADQGRGLVNVRS